MKYIYRKTIILVITILSLINQGFSQAQPADTTAAKLPFALAEEKRLSDEDLQNKKEGTYFAGVPEFSSDPLNGFGFGVEGSVIFNGKRNDPFFAYTPYRSKLDVVAFYTTNKQREFKVSLDVPYIFNSKWRLRMEGAYEVNPNLVYFGTTEKSLNPLNYFLDGSTSGNLHYKDYENQLPGDSSRFNGYTKSEYIYNISAEHSFFEGKMRVLGGFEFAYLDVTPYQGASLVRQDYDNHKIRGLYKGPITIVQAGLVWDTRDLEPDPSRGMFFEITNELSLKALGSKYDFNKVFTQIKGYQRVLPNIFKKMILAGRFGIGYTAWNAPFFEFQDEWSSEGSIEGLGGTNTLRGYKQSRFLARGMDFGNVELRTRFAQTTIGEQHLAFSAVPFFDFGGVWNSFKDVGKMANYRYNEGLGLRVAWNVSTILRFDYAVSQEDKQFFFSFGQAF